MRRIIRHLFVLVLVPATMQSGMAQWTPHFGADMTRDSGIASAHLDSGHGGHAHDSLLPDKKAGAPPEAGYGERCQQPSIGCDCPGCLDYLVAHSLTLPFIAAIPLHVPQPGVHDSDIIASFVDLHFAPPTPPPRLQHLVISGPDPRDGLHRYTNFVRIPLPRYVGM